MNNDVKLGGKWYMVIIKGIIAAFLIRICVPVIIILLMKLIGILDALDGMTVPALKFSEIYMPIISLTVISITSYAAFNLIRSKSKGKKFSAVYGVLNCVFFILILIFLSFVITEVNSIPVPVIAAVVSELV